MWPTLCSHSSWCVVGYIAFLDSACHAIFRQGHPLLLLGLWHISHGIGNILAVISLLIHDKCTQSFSGHAMLKYVGFATRVVQLRDNSMHACAGSCGGPLERCIWQEAISGAVIRMWRGTGRGPAAVHHLGHLPLLVLPSVGAPSCLIWHLSVLAECFVPHNVHKCLSTSFIIDIRVLDTMSSGAPSLMLKLSARGSCCT